MTLEDQKNVLQSLRDVLELAYQSAEPVCCGRPGQECCGSPEPEWGPFEQTIMDTLGPAEKVLAESVEAAGNCQGILDSSACEVPEGLDATQEEWARINGRKHIPGATKMVQGDVQCMGNLYFNDEDSYDHALVITFADREALKAALDSKQCRFTVFGGEV